MDVGHRIASLVKGEAGLIEPLQRVGGHSTPNYTRKTFKGFGGGD